MIVNPMIFFVTHANANATLRSTRTTNPAKAFSIATNSPKPVNITVWRECDEPNCPFYPSNFVCDTNEEVYRAFSLITSVTREKTL